MAELPSGTVTFLFTDIEGSTRLLREFGGRYGELLAEHQRIQRAAFAPHGGHEVDSQGESSFVAFRRAKDAVAAAVDAQRDLAAHSWPQGAEVRVRMGLHTGEPQVGEERYVGIGVHKAARIGAAGHGGQVLLSRTTRELVEDELPPGVTIRDLGERRLKDLDRPDRLSQLVIEGLQSEFGPLKTLDLELRRKRRRMYVGFALTGVLVAAVAIPVFALRQGSGGSAAVEPNSVAIIDPDSNKVVGSVSVGSGSEPTRVAGAGSSIWVLNAGVSTLSKIDPGTARVTDQIPLGTLHPFSLAASRSAVWVLGTTEVLSSSIIRVDPAYDKKVARRDLGKFIATGYAGGSSGPGAVALRAGALWVGGPSGDLYQLDPETLAIKRRLETEGVVRALAVASDAVWAIVGKSRVIRIDPRAPSVEEPFVVGLGAVAIAVDDQAVWVAAAESDTLSRIDVATGTVTGVPVGDDPRDVAVAFGSVWVANSNDGTVWRIDPETRKIVATIPVGVRVEGIASAGGKLWVTGQSPL
jgi:YVTN family beta-propeller protein